MAVGLVEDAIFREEFHLPTGQGVLDIWQEILGYLTEPTDFHNLLLASPKYFEPFLKHQKTATLFALVLKVLDRRDYIAKSTTLQCRLLSRFTKSSIDKWIRDGNPCVENLDGWDHDKWDPKHSELHCWMRGRTRRWENHYDRENINCNPFLGGDVTLYATWDIHQKSEMLPDFRFLLANFGKEISHFRYVASYDQRIQNLELLRECLEQMPNLRTLDLSYCSITFPLEDKPSQSFLPNLRKLSTLKIVCTYSTRLVRFLLEKYRNQLKKLCLVGTPNHFQSLQLGLVGNLEHLSLPWISHVYHIDEYLCSVREWAPYLVTLSVRVSGNTGYDIFLQVLHALENCFGTSRKLQNLNIYMSGRNKYIATPASFFLPSLKRLWIRCTDCCLLSIHFIMGMRETLEELTLDVRFYPTGELRRLQEDSQFNHLLDRINRVNIWDQMSRLERITIRKRIGKDDWSETAAQVYSYTRPQTGQIAAKH